MNWPTILKYLIRRTQYIEADKNLWWLPPDCQIARLKAVEDSSHIAQKEEIKKKAKNRILPRSMSCLGTFSVQ